MGVGADDDLEPWIILGDPPERLAGITVDRFPFMRPGMELDATGVDFDIDIMTDGTFKDASGDILGMPVKGEGPVILTPVIEKIKVGMDQDLEKAGRQGRFDDIGVTADVTAGNAVITIVMDAVSDVVMDAEHQIIQMGKQSPVIIIMALDILDLKTFPETDLVLVPAGCFSQVVQIDIMKLSQAHASVLPVFAVKFSVHEMSGDRTMVGHAQFGHPESDCFLHIIRCHARGMTT